MPAGCAMSVVAIFMLGVAALMLFPIAGQALWYLIESQTVPAAWMFAFAVLVVLLVIIEALARRLSINSPGWSNVGKFFLAAFAIAFRGCMGALAISSWLSLKEDFGDAGASVWALLSGAAGIVELCTAGLLLRTRRAQAAESSGRRDAGAAQLDR